MLKINDILVFENEKTKFYKNELCKDLTNYIRKDDDLKNIKGLKHWSILAAELKKDNIREFIIFNENGDYIDSALSFEAACYKIDALKMINNC